MQKNKSQANENYNNTGLVILKNQKKKLSKQQQTFNKLIKKIDKLRLDVITVSQQLDVKLDFFIKNIHPEFLKSYELNKEMIKILFTFYKNKKVLTNRKRKYLGELIGSLIEQTFEYDEREPDEDIKKIFEAIFGTSYEKALTQERDEMKDELQSVFEDFGFKINLKDLQEDMTADEIMQKVLEMKEEMTKQANEQQQKRSSRKKNTAQQDKEEKAKKIAEARAKNISSIYKQLAKILHPDLEQNEELKLQKEELMKQLTNAYEHNDLHTLLNLELTWIKNEENNPGNLTDDKLDIYNEVLREQITELEDEIHFIIQHPRYAPLQKISPFPQEITSSDLKDQKLYLEKRNNVFVNQIRRLKGDEREAMVTLKKMLQELEEDAKRFEEENDTDWFI